MGLVNYFRKKITPFLDEEKLNTFHLLKGQILQFSLSFCANIYFFRKLNIVDVGIFYSILAYTTLFGVLSGNWLRECCINELVLKKHTEKVVLGSSVFILLIAGISTFILSILVIGITKGLCSFFYLNMIASITFLFAPFNVIQIYFDSVLQSKINSRIIIKASLFSNILRMLFLYFSENIYLLVIIHVSSTILISYISIVEFKKYKNYSFFDINLGTTELAKSLFKKSSPLIFSNFAIILYLKVDQIMLEELSGEVEVALYSAALKFVEIFYVIPMALYTSFYPILVKTHENNKDLFFELVSKKVTIMINVFIVVGSGLMIFSPFIGELFYGSKYKNIGELIFGLSFTIFFVNLGYIKTAFLIVTGHVRINLIINVIASVFNILANYFILPLYGAKGAVIVSIVTYAYVNFISCAFFKETKPLYKIFIARMRNNFLSNKFKKIRFS